MGEGQRGDVERGNFHWVKDWEVDVEEEGEDDEDEEGFVVAAAGGGGGGSGGGGRGGGSGGSCAWWEGEMGRGGEVGVVGLREGWVVVQWRKKAQEKSGRGGALSFEWLVFMAVSAPERETEVRTRNRILRNGDADDSVGVQKILTG